MIVVLIIIGSILALYIAAFVWAMARGRGKRLSLLEVLGGIVIAIVALVVILIEAVAQIFRKDNWVQGR